jgi:hypothetical protein
MNAKPNLSGSLGRQSSKNLRIPQMPLEWLDGGAWRLPSGKALAEFALQAGFLAPLLLNSESFTDRSRTRSEGGRALPMRGKPLGKEGPR